MHDDTLLQEIEDSSSKMFTEWSQKWFWRRRLPGFLQLRKIVTARIRNLMHNESGRKRYFGVAQRQEITLDRLVLQAMVVNNNGYKFDFKVTYHPPKTERTDLGPSKKDNWETAIVEVSPEWRGFQLVVSPNS